MMVNVWIPADGEVSGLRLCKCGRRGIAVCLLMSVFIDGFIYIALLQCGKCFPGTRGLEGFSGFLSGVDRDGCV